MARRKRAHQSVKDPTAPLVDMMETGLRSMLAAYQQWRTTLPLTERLAELLWSLEGMNLEIPSSTIEVPDAKRTRFGVRRAGKDFWLRRKLDRQKQHGDGHLNNRAKLQRDALELCRNKVYTPLCRMQAKAHGSRQDWDTKLHDQKVECDACWQVLQTAICDIGERFRDAYWLDMHSREVLRTIREDYRPKVQDHARLPHLLLHYKFVREHLGALVDPDAQAYIEALARVIELWPKVRPRLDFSAFLPVEASYRGKDGRPQPPVTRCEKALRALEPKLPAKAVHHLRVAWCLTAKRKTPA